MGATFVVRKGFAAAVALLNRGAIKRYYRVTQQAHVFVVVVNWAPTSITTLISVPRRETQNDPLLA